MVARPSMILRIEPMRMEDLPAVHAIERASFDAPWPPEAYQHDLETNRLAQYLVARVGDEIAAYGGMWLMVDEGHIITFAVHPDWRRHSGWTAKVMMCPSSTISHIPPYAAISSPTRATRYCASRLVSRSLR